MVWTFVTLLPEMEEHVQLQRILTYPDYWLIRTPVWEPISIPQQKMTHLSGQSVLEQRCPDTRGSTVHPYSPIVLLHNSFWVIQNWTYTIGNTLRITLHRYLLFPVLYVIWTPKLRDTLTGEHMFLRTSLPIYQICTSTRVPPPPSPSYLCY